MKLPVQVLEEFRRQGRRGGLARRRNMSPAARSSVARLAVMRRWIRARFGASSFAELGVPAGDLVDDGLAALVAGKETLESLLIRIAGPRLHRERVPLPKDMPACMDPEQRLYERIGRETIDPDLAHTRYNALLRRIDGFSDALRALDESGR